MKQKVNILQLMSSRRYVMQYFQVRMLSAVQLPVLLQTPSVVILLSAQVLQVEDVFLQLDFGPECQGLFQGSGKRPGLSTGIISFIP